MPLFTPPQDGIWTYVLVRTWDLLSSGLLPITLVVRMHESVADAFAWLPPQPGLDHTFLSPDLTPRQPPTLHVSSGSLTVISLLSLQEAALDPIVKRKKIREQRHTHEILKI